MSISAIPSLSTLMNVKVRTASTHQWAEIDLPDGNRDRAALCIALHIAWQRCGGAPQYYDAWVRRYDGGPEHAQDLLVCLEAFLGSDSIGTRASPSPQVHLDGFVAEHIWHLLTIENALTFGLPVKVDGPAWSVTDSGGDGLAIYRIDDRLSFRLWESKAHTGEGTVRDVVNGACRQIESKALRYLARFSKVGQSTTDDELQHFYGLLPELWRDAAPEAGGGVSVSTTSSSINDCFGNLAAYWKFTHFDQRQGLVVVVDDYSSFAALVREHLWKGL